LGINNGGYMKKILIAVACATLLSGPAFAQTTGPAGQQDTNKPGMANPQGKSSGAMNSGTSSGSMDRTTGMSKDGNMNRGAESKDADGMAKGGMKK
jgi:hypothetical protein